MNQQQQIASDIPHAYRDKILNQWLPVAVPSMENMGMQNLFNAWYIYVEPNGVANSNCPVCVGNVLSGWLALRDDLIAAELQYHLLNAI